MDFDKEKIRDLIVPERAELETIPEYAIEGITRRTLENSEEEIVEEAIDVARRGMRNSDDKIALDAANKAMTWLGKGTKGKTTIIADKAQINQIDHDPKMQENILSALSGLTKITSGIKTEGTGMTDV